MPWMIPRAIQQGSNGSKVKQQLCMTTWFLVASLVIAETFPLHADGVSDPCHKRSMKPSLKARVGIYCDENSKRSGC